MTTREERKTMGRDRLQARGIDPEPAAVSDSDIGTVAAAFTAGGFLG
jgi:hypothetical protein